MKHILLIYLLFFCKIVSAQTTHTLPYPVTAEQLNTDQDVQTLMDSLLGREDMKLHVGNIRMDTGRSTRDSAAIELADSLGVTNSFYKADFDGNGMMDIIVSGKFYDNFKYFAVLFYKKQQYRLIWLNRGIFTEKTVFHTIRIHGQPALNFYTDPHPGLIEEGEKPEFTKKTLVIYAGDFVEYNPLVKKHTIEKITYSTGYCFGTCPVFEIAINASRYAQLEARSYNDGKPGQHLWGNYAVRVRKKEYTQLIQLLNYIDFESLEDEYTVHWTDDQSCTLTITYDGGKVKKIEDYGLLGTFGLNHFYQLLSDFRFNQEWEKFGEQPKGKEARF